MDFYSSLTSWSLFAVAVGAGCWYYWPAGQNQPKRAPVREDKGQPKKSKSEAESRGRSIRRPTSEDDLSTGVGKVPNLAETAARKRKAQQPQAEQPAVAPQVVVDEEKESEADKQWAERMAQTQKGTNLSTAAKKKDKLKTVKQSSAINTPEVSAQASPQLGSEAEDGAVADTPMLNAGDVNDMLEPVASGPSILRVTPSTKPQRENTPRKAKEEVVESKKQRQNRKKVEERREQREAEEKVRKALEEKQRRAAREARGEPARNGIPVSKPPTSNAWQQQRSAAQPSDTTTTPQVDNNINQPLLDTFDNESTASSLAPSTTTTSVEDGETGGMSYEDQIAQAKRNSEDDGWTTVAQPKKSKKKPEGQAPTSEPVLANKTNGQKAAPAVKGKPKGFQALYVPDESTGSDPNDPSSWDA